MVPECEFLYLFLVFHFFGAAPLVDSALVGRGFGGVLEEVIESRRMHHLSRWLMVGLCHLALSQIQRAITFGVSLLILESEAMPNPRNPLLPDAPIRVVDPMDPDLSQSTWLDASMHNLYPSALSRPRRRLYRKLSGRLCLCSM